MAAFNFSTVQVDAFCITPTLVSDANNDIMTGQTDKRYTSNYYLLHHHLHCIDEVEYFLNLKKIKNYLSPLLITIKSLPLQYAT